MTRSKFLAEMDRILEVEPGTTTGEESLDDLPTWDSVALMGFIAMADAEAGMKLAPRDIGRCATMGELMALLKVQD